MTPDTLRALLDTHRLAVLEASGPWCTVETAAIHLRVSRSEIYKMRRAGKLKAYGIPGKSHVRFKREELDALMVREDWVRVAAGEDAEYKFPNQHTPDRAVSADNDL